MGHFLAIKCIMAFPLSPLWTAGSGESQLPCREDTQAAGRGPRGEERRCPANGSSRAPSWEWTLPSRTSLRTVRPGVRTALRPNSLPSHTRRRHLPAVAPGHCVLSTWPAADRRVGWFCTCDVPGRSGLCGPLPQGHVGRAGEGLESAFSASTGADSERSPGRLGNAAFPSVTLFWVTCLVGTLDDFGASGPTKYHIPFVQGLLRFPRLLFIKTS